MAKNSWIYETGRVSGLSPAVSRPPPWDRLSALDINGGIQKWKDAANPLDPESFCHDKSWRREVRFPTYSKAPTPLSRSLFTLYNLDDPVTKALARARGINLPATEPIPIYSKQFHAPDGRPWWDERITSCGPTTWDLFLGKWTRSTEHIPTAKPSAYSAHDSIPSKILSTQNRQHGDLVHRGFGEEPLPLALASWLVIASSMERSKQDIDSDSETSLECSPSEKKLPSTPNSKEKTTPDTELSTGSGAHVNVPRTPLPLQALLLPQTSSESEDDARSWRDLEHEIDAFIQSGHVAQQETAAQKNKAARRGAVAITQPQFSHQAFLAQNPQLQALGQNLAKQAPAQQTLAHPFFDRLPPTEQQHILTQSALASLPQPAAPRRSLLGPKALKNAPAERAAAQQALASSNITPHQQNQCPNAHRFSHPLNPVGLITARRGEGIFINIPCSGPNVRIENGNQVFRITVDSLKAQIHDQYLFHASIPGMGAHLEWPPVVTSSSTKGVYFEITPKVWHWLIENIGDENRGWFEKAWDRVMPCLGEEGYAACPDCPAVERTEMEENAGTNVVNSVPTAVEEGGTEVSNPDVESEVVEGANVEHSKADEENSDGGDAEVSFKMNQTLA